MSEAEASLDYSRVQDSLQLHVDKRRQGSNPVFKAGIGELLLSQVGLHELETNEGVPAVVCF